MRSNRKSWLFWVAVPLAVGALASFLSREAMADFYITAAKPPLSPPRWVFPVVWTALYVLMGVGAYRVQGTEGRNGLGWFWFQLILNFFWTLIFFNAAAYGLAAVWIAVLWGAVLMMTLRFCRVDPAAAWLQVPYLIWLTFAAYLTFGVWIMNG